jgi:hypothetical protein
MVGRIAMVLLAAGCGRVGYDEIAPDSGGGDSDSGGDSGARTYLFQDGFEGALDPWTPLGNVVLDTGVAPVEGTSILRAQAGSASSSRAEVMLARNIASGSFFVRAYYYLPSGYPITDLSLLEVVQASTENIIVMSVPELAYLSQIDGTGEVSTFVVPRDQWLCIETRVGVANEPNGSIDIWVDGILRYSTTGLDTFSAGVDELHTGVTWAGPGQSPSSVYVDDVIADDVALIGCR